MAVAVKPLNRASKKKKEEVGRASKPCNVAAIDFGTTSVSLAYTTDGDKINTFFIDQIHERVPNAILLERMNDGTCEVKAFGTRAQDAYAKLLDHQNYIYFERIKMLLERDEAIDRTSTVESFTGGSYYLVEVIAFILKYWKSSLLDTLRHTSVAMQPTDFDWIITVPAIWKARAKRLMREAAYMAGLTTLDPGICTFTPPGHDLPCPVEENADKITLALEPEVAAIYAQKDTKGIHCLPPKRYMVLDIGGGTIDITVQDYNESVDKISVTLTPTGNSWGGTTVNRAFLELIEGVVNDKGFSKFLSGPKKKTNEALLNKILYKEFEEEKKKFGELGLIATTKDDVMRLELPSGFCKKYGTIMNDRCCDGVEFHDDDDLLDISYRTVKEKIFKKTIDAIIAAFKSALQSVNDIDTIYLVGGFGGSNYIFQTLRTELSKMFNDKEITLLCPKCPHLAVCHGAVIWHLHPEIIQSRKADATYGISRSPAFDDLKHDVHYRYFDKEDQCYRCNNVFTVFIQKGETVNADEIITTSLIPRNACDTQITTTIYSTDFSDIQYIKDKSGKLNVKKIGELKLDVPNPNNLPRSQRTYDVSMDFSGTEIKASAKYRITGQEVKTVCDFLSAQH